MRLFLGGFSEFPFVNPKPVTPDDLLLGYPFVTTVTPDYLGYNNPRTTAAYDSLDSGEVSFLKFIPVEALGFLIVLAAKAGEEGALSFNRSESRRTGIVSMRMALLKFNVTMPKRRKLRLPLEWLPVAQPDGSTRMILLIRVKGPKSKRRTQRTKAAPPQAPAPAQA